jgi:glycosyltransferase involved in cell wall biosynthesis
VKALPGDVPLQAVYCWHPMVTRMLRELVASPEGRPPFDVVHVEHLRGALYGVWLKRWMKDQGLGIPVLWDSVDCITLLFRQASMASKSTFGRLVTRLELGRTERFERKMVEVFDAVTATSVLDAEALWQLRENGSKAGPIRVLTNGVDLKSFSPGERGQRLPRALVMSGKMSYHANITMALDFVHQILPRIQARHPDVELWIVGKDPGPELRALHHPPGVRVTGTVPDLRPYLQRATVAVVPLPYGAGVQFKVLEAMACGTPVVVSAVGTRGLRIQAGRDALVAEGEAQFADEVARLLADPDLQARVGQAGRRYVEEHHDWSRIAVELEGVYDELIRSRN